MVERFTAALSSLDVDGDLILDLLLTYIIMQSLRTQSYLNIAVLLNILRRYHPGSKLHFFCLYHLFHLVSS